MKKIIATIIATGLLLTPLAVAAPAQAATKYKRGTTFHAATLVNALNADTADMTVTHKGKAVASGVAKYKARKKGTYKFAVTYKPAEWSTSNYECRVTSETVVADRTRLTDSGKYRDGQIDMAYALACTVSVVYYTNARTGAEATQVVSFPMQVTDTTSVYDSATTPLADTNGYVVGDVYYDVYSWDAYPHVPEITVNHTRVVR